MGAWQARWTRFWFAPSSPEPLGICRALFFGLFFLVYRRAELSAWASVDEVFWMPIPLFQALGLPVLSAASLEAFHAVWLAALGASCLGLWTRASTAAAFLLGIYGIGLPHNFGKIHHLDGIVLLSMGILALSRCGDAWSLDRWRARAATAGRGPEDSGEYTWPVRLVQVLMTLAFFGAGVSKLRHAGLAWVFSDNMAMVFIQANQPLSRRLAPYDVLCRIFAAGAIAAETGAPLALFNRWARRLLIPGLFFMQAGIWFVMHVRFHAFLACYLFWVPWGRVLVWLRAAAGARG